MIKETIANSSFEPFRTYEAIRPKSKIFAEHSGPLRGKVTVSGTKNMVSMVIAASLSAEEGKTVIRNVPFVGDLDITLALCRRLGVKYTLNPDRTLELSVGKFSNPNILHDPYHGNRVAILFAGPVLAKLGVANISKPEGCLIGERKIDFHLAGLEKFGVKIVDNNDHYSLKLVGRQLRGTHYDMPFPSVGATENMLITASCAEGETVLTNCAIEPEIVELIKILQRSGVKIGIFPPRTIEIKGGKHEMATPLDIIPDRVEAASLAIAALSTKGDVFVQGAQQESIITFLGTLQKMGAGLDIKPDGIRFFWKGPLKPVDVTTEVYPGFPTDFQQPMAILMSQARGQSSIHETIFENRFRYLDELNRIIRNGQQTTVSNNCPAGETCRFNNSNHKHTAHFNGPIRFGAGQIEITDLRAGFTAINAAILSMGVTVSNLKGLYRGYEDPVGKLKSLGAKIELII